MRGFASTDNPDIFLLLERLAMLQIDPDRLNAHDPLLFRELQGRCTLCRSKVACTLDFAMRPDPPASLRSWQSYCPNEGILTDLAAHFAVDDLAKLIAHALHSAGLASLSEKFKADLGTSERSNRLHQCRAVSCTTSTSSARQH